MGWSASLDKCSCYPETVGVLMAPGGLNDLSFRRFWAGNLQVCFVGFDAYRCRRKHTTSGRCVFIQRPPLHHQEDPVLVEWG